MKILQRYVLQELWFPFLLSLVTLNFIFMGGYLVRASHFIIGQGVPLTDTFYILFLALPEMISFTVPISLLTAVLLVIGGLSQHNEIRAIRASGINPLSMMKPTFLVGLALTCFMLVFNDQVSSNTGFLLRKESKRIALKNPMALIEPGRFVQISDSIIFYAKRVKNRHQLEDIVAYETEAANQPVRTIIAERGEITSVPGRGEIQIRLFDGSISDADGKSVQAIQFQTYEFPTMGQQDIRMLRKKTRELSIAEMLVKMAPGNLSKSDLRETKSAFHQRIAFSFGCFLFVFIGIPIAMAVNRGELVTSFGIAMAGASFYYVLFSCAKTLAYEGILPPLLAFWLPNLILLGGGIYLNKKSFHF